MKKNNFSFRKLFANNRFSGIFAFVTAFIIWLVITIDQTEVISRQFNVTVNISTEGSYAESLKLEAITPENGYTVTVTAHGPNSAVSSLTDNDIIIVPDLSKVTEAGIKEIPLSVKHIENQSGITFSVSPKTIKINFDTMTEKEFDVAVSASGITLKADANKNLFIGDPVVNDTAVTVADKFFKINISGASTNVNRISKVEAVISTTEEIDKTGTYSADITLYDEDGKKLDKSLYTLPIEKVNVVVPVYKERTLSVTPVFTHEPVVGVGKERVRSVSVPNIIVYGQPEVIDALDDIKLSDIDYREVLKGKTFFTVSLKIPGGVYTKTEIKDVVVTLEVV